MSAIEWTDKTWNPVTGCTKISEGCANCYMYAQYPRLRAMGTPGYELDPDQVAVHHDRFEKPYNWYKPRRVFVCSMSDLFHRDVSDADLVSIFNTMEFSPQHSFQVLTKRPGRAADFFHFRCQPPDNVWMGTSVESQKYAPRLDQLALIPAAVRFVSAEPLLGPLDLRKWLRDGTLHWVIVGGESGPRARPMDLDWARDIRDQCVEAGVPFFLKQLGGRRGKRSGAEAVLDGKTWNQYPKKKE